MAQRYLLSSPELGPTCLPGVYWAVHVMPIYAPTLARRHTPMQAVHIPPTALKPRHPVGPATPRPSPGTDDQTCARRRAETYERGMSVPVGATSDLVGNWATVHGEEVWRYGVAAQRGSTQCDNTMVCGTSQCIGNLPEWWNPGDIPGAESFVELRGTVAAQVRQQARPSGDRGRGHVGTCLSANVLVLWMDRRCVGQEFDGVAFPPGLTADGLWRRPTEDGFAVGVWAIPGGREATGGVECKVKLRGDLRSCVWECSLL